MKKENCKEEIKSDRTGTKTLDPVKTDRHTQF
jgi:hypothetical protein